MARWLTEAQVKKRVKKQLGEYTKRFWYMPGSSPFTTMDGQPDIILVWKGVYIGIEVKGPKYRQSPEQRIFQKRLVDAGGIYLLVTSYNIHKFPFYLRLIRWMIGKKHAIWRSEKAV